MNIELFLFVILVLVFLLALIGPEDHYPTDGV